MLATRSIKAQAQQERCRQACTIGLSINEDTKLEKGKGKKSSATRYFIWSSGHVTATVRDYLKLPAIVRHNLPFSTSAVISPPPLVKPALRLCGCIIPVGRSCPYALLVAYRLYYASILSIY